MKPSEARRTPKNCRCGSGDIYLQTWCNGKGARYWCAGCAAGTPARPDTWDALIVNADGWAADAALEAWNKWATAEAPEERGTKSS